ncbi:hypothetical protein D3C86_2006090 [compost metagenome]
MFGIMPATHKPSVKRHARMSGYRCVTACTMLKKTAVLVAIFSNNRGPTRSESMPSKEENTITAREVADKVMPSSH